ncbi:MAG: hydrogenase maturation protease, partial [Candidatus Zixiibacteriota bacterium]
MEDPNVIVVIGLGNDFRGDDAVGLYTARLLAKKNIPGMRIIEGVSDGTSLIDVWSGTQACFLIDCVYSQKEPGHIHRFDALTDDIPEDIFPGYSTHAFSITGAVKLARTIDR